MTATDRPRGEGEQRRCQAAEMGGSIIGSLKLISAFVDYPFSFFFFNVAENRTQHMLGRAPCHRAAFQFCLLLLCPNSINGLESTGLIFIAEDWTGGPERLYEGPRFHFGLKGKERTKERAKLSRPCDE